MEPMVVWGDIISGLNLMHSTTFLPAAAPRVHNAVERGMNSPKIIESPYRRHFGTSTILIEG